MTTCMIDWEECTYADDCDGCPKYAEWQNEWKIKGEVM